MIPDIIIHNSVSLDGSFTGFMPDMGLHYKIAGGYRPDAHLIGADTIIAGNEMFGEGIPDELASDFEQPHRETGLPCVNASGTTRPWYFICNTSSPTNAAVFMASSISPASNGLSGSCCS